MVRLVELDDRPYCHHLCTRARNNGLERFEARDRFDTLEVEGFELCSGHLHAERAVAAVSTGGSINVVDHQVQQDSIEVVRQHCE